MKMFAKAVGQPRICQSSVDGHQLPRTCLRCEPGDPCACPICSPPRGRLAAFFFLYVTEGIPLGFAATAVATQLRRQDVGPAEIGAFVGSFYLPWAFKWAFGPFVDVFASERLGRRRGWIIVTQVLMALTLLSTVMLKLPRAAGRCSR